MKIRNMKQVGERVKEIKMKRLFRRNQIIITTLAVMIAAAGYLNYAGKRDLEAGGQVADMGSLELSDEDLMAENLAAQSETVQDILSLFTVLTAGLGQIRSFCLCLSYLCIIWIIVQT